VGTSLEYAITPRLSTSVGYMVTKTGIDADRMLPEAPELSAKTYCGGFAYNPSENLTITLAVSKTIYDAESTPMGVALDKMAPAVGVGVEWKL
jgi:long-subunit fatty acid transport protein